LERGIGWDLHITMELEEEVKREENTATLVEKVDLYQLGQKGKRGSVGHCW
jgi:hypothetical protein